MLIDQKAIARGLVASAIMASVILVLQYMIYDPHLLSLYLVMGATVYIVLIRNLNVLDREDVELLRQVTGKRAAKYVIGILTRTK